MGKEVDFTFKIGGEAGYGIMSTGLIFSKLAMRSGYFVFDSNEYPSLIRGGHNTYTVRVSEKEIYSNKKAVDLLIALNQNALDFHKDELSKRAIVIANTDKIKKFDLREGKLFKIPLTSLAKKTSGQEVMQNSVGLGAAIYFLEGELKILEEIMKEIFPAENAQLNIKAAHIGFDFAKENFPNQKSEIALKKQEAKRKILLTGNDAICLGAVKAGCKFVAIYPMTPINSILAYFSKNAKKLGIIYFQPEDEIAGINSAIGASFAGLRSMVATSGGGFSLMVEALGLAGMTETPIVIVEGQRVGPSTGMPTWTEQGDLRFLLTAGHGAFPRILVAPGDPRECFFLTIEAFNLAEKYQMPAIILVDKFLAESHKSEEVFETKDIKIKREILLQDKGNYKRYEITPSGISPRKILITEGEVFLANSYEHNEFGFSTEDKKVREAMVEKRMRKFKNLEKEIPQPKVYGEKEASLTFVGWGSVKGPVLEAQKILEREKIKTNFLYLNYLSPFSSGFVFQFLKKCRKPVLVEQNATAQLASLIQEKTGFAIKEFILKYDGRPFFPEEIAEKAKQIL